MTQTEMTAHARDMVRGTSVPVIADADTGYGGVNNLHRTIEEYVQAGVAAVHLEDQILPKKCGQLGGIRLETPGANVRRLKAAMTARGDSDMVIIARTDALGVDGLEAALDRAKAYADAGVDHGLRRRGEDYRTGRNHRPDAGFPARAEHRRWQ